MERRSFVQGAGLAGVLAAGVAPAVVHAQANIRWRLASSFPKSLETLFGGAETFAKNVTEATGGKFTVSVHAAGELVPAFGVVDGVQSALPAIAYDPSRVTATENTSSVGWLIVSRRWPESTSQTFTVSSAQPLRRTRPSGENASA